MIKFNVQKRFSSEIAFTAEIDCSEDASYSLKLGLAVKWAYKNGADLRGADLRDAYLSGAYLRDASLRDADLRDAYLRDAYLSGANLSGADLRDASLRDAYLRGANLSGADLRDAYLGELKGVPFIKNIHQTVYAAASQSCALDMSQWHCGTSHCRAGWVVTLAGEGGAAMEYCMGTPAAVALIYMKSDPTLEKIPDFYNMDNEAVLADMKRMAEAEAGVTNEGEREDV